MGLSMFSPGDDFFTDRVCRRYGVLVFLAAAILLAGAFSSDWALSCWNPSHFTGGQTGFSTHTCWNNGQFSILDFEDYTAFDQEKQSQFDLSKMRYFPVVLILQMLVFLAPRVFWRAITTISGYFTERLVSGCYALSRNTNHTASAGVTNAIPPDAHTDGKTDAKRGYDVLAANLVAALTSPFPVLSGVCSMFGGYTLAVAYMLTKFGYLLTSIIQMGILSAYLDVNFYTLRFGSALWDTITVSKSEVITHFNTTTYEARISPLFPRSVLCEFKVARLGNIQHYGVQCELSANLLVERVTVCLWIWLWFTFLLLLVSTFTWLIRLAFYFIAPQNYKTKRVMVLLGRQSVIAKQASQKTSSDKNLDEFVKLLLKPDGALILEMLEDNVSLIAASEIVKAAWVQFQANSEARGPTRQMHGQHGGPELGMQSHTARSPDTTHASTVQAPVVSGVYPRLSGQPHSASAPETLPLVEKTNF